MKRLEIGKKEADLLVNTFLESIIESLKTGPKFLA
jgi:nucleoid DNA-binding protein